MKFIVPITDPVMTYKERFSQVGSFDAIGRVLMDDHAPHSTHLTRPITNMFYWDRHPLGIGSVHWETWYSQSYKDGFVLPEQGKSYLRWLVKGELKDTFDGSSEDF